MHCAVKQLVVGYSPCDARSDMRYTQSGRSGQRQCRAQYYSGRYCKLHSLWHRVIKYISYYTTMRRRYDGSTRKREEKKGEEIRTYIRVGKGEERAVLKIHRTAVDRGTERAMSPSKQFREARAGDASTATRTRRGLLLPTASASEIRPPTAGLGYRALEPVGAEGKCNLAGMRSSPAWAESTSRLGSAGCPRSNPEPQDPTRGHLRFARPRKGQRQGSGWCSKLRTASWPPLSAP